jgi:hypothetical protein
VPAPADVLRKEREPEDGHVAEVEANGPGDDDLAEDQLHAVGGEMVVRDLEVAGRERPVAHPERVAPLQGGVAVDEPFAPRGSRADQRAAPARRVVDEHAVGRDDLAGGVRERDRRVRRDEIRRVHVDDRVGVQSIAQSP